MNSVALVAPAFAGMQPSMHPPLGLITVRSALMHVSGIDCAIFDEFDVTDESIEFLAEKFRVVGIQAHSLNVRAALWLGKALRSAGCRVVLGGPEVSLAEEFSWAEDGCDLVIRHHMNVPACFAVEALLEGDVPNRVIHGGLTLPERIDYDGMDLSVYWQRGSEFSLGGRHAPVVTHLGCSFRDRSRGGCSFCANDGTTTSVRGGRELAAECAQLNSGFAVDSFYCVGENLARGMLHHMTREFEPPLGSCWSFFARASEITTKSAESHRRFGTSQIRLGAESGDAALLAATAKDETIESIEAALAELDHAGISAVTSFVLGLPGESEASLERSCRKAEQWTAKFSRLRVAPSVVIPLPGSHLGKMAGVRAGTGVCAADQDTFLQRFTDVTRRQVESAVQRLAKLPSFEHPIATSVMGPFVSTGVESSRPYVQCA